MTTLNQDIIRTAANEILTALADEYSAGNLDITGDLSEWIYTSALDADNDNADAIDSRVATLVYDLRNGNGDTDVLKAALAGARRYDHGDIESAIAYELDGRGEYRDA